MFTLAHVVPWGRSFDEYRRMFSLDDRDLGRHILGCGDGPASFNAEATRRHARVVSCDPLYRWDAGAIRGRIDATRQEVLEQTHRNQAQFVWDAIGSVDELARIRMAAMGAFLDDYAAGAARGRYVAGGLPALPFVDGAFDLALCSHFLFLYSEHLDGTFHQAALAELCRVAAEVRIFPLLALDGSPSPFVDSGIAALRADGHAVTVEHVPYEFQRGGNQMLRVVTRAAGR